MLVPFSYDTDALIIFVAQPSRAAAAAGLGLAADGLGCSPADGLPANGLPADGLG